MSSTRPLTMLVWSAVFLLLECSPHAEAASRAKLLVSETGLYRVSGAELRAAGVDLGEVRPERLGLECRGEPVACRVAHDGGGALADSSVVIFYGEALDTRFTDTNVYWLDWEGEGGLRIQEGAEAAGARGVIHVTIVERFEENHHLGKLLFAPDEVEFDHWMWAHSSPGEPAEAVVRPARTPLPGSKLQVRVALRGRTAVAAEPDHHTVVEVGGDLLEDARWDGQVEWIAEGAVAAGALDDGEMSVKVTCVGDTEAADVDSVALDYVDVTYRAEPDVRAGQLLVRVDVRPPGVSLNVGRGASLEAALDVTEPRSPVALHTADDQGSTVAHVTGQGERQVLLVASDAALRPGISVTNAPESLRQAQPGDYLIVAHPSLVPALDDLVAHRAADGLVPQIALITQVYDEYSWGVETPEAIREFVSDAYARAPADRKPRFLLLVGDASYDYRDYEGTGIANLVPTVLRRTTHGLETAVDAYFGMVGDEEGEETVAVGRIPARTPDEVRTYVGKVLTYEREMLSADAPWRSRVLHVADHDQTSLALGRYEDGTASLARAMRAKGLEVSEAYVRSHLSEATVTGQQRRAAVRAEMTSSLMEALRRGNAVMTYRGHGGEWGWSRERALLTEDVLKLGSSEGLAVVLDTSCFTGWFDKPMTDPEWSIAEAMIFSEAPFVACVSPSRLGGDPLDEAMLGVMLRTPDSRLGEVMVAARRKLRYNRAWLDWIPAYSYCLLGDPALRIGLKAPTPTETGG